MSATTQPRLVKCPTCDKAVAWTSEQKFRPFCSERCKLIDLGEWVMEEKKIAGESVLLDVDNASLDFWQ
jgi:endogenous inhibitor of DNA gyrase (YacG/DUF329 family)